MAKREPLLIDQIIANRNDATIRMMDPRDLKTFMSVAGDAKKFVFNMEGAQYLARMVIEYPHKMMDMMEFALPSYPHMWIEYPFAAFRQTEGIIKPSNRKRDNLCGFLITNNTVFRVVQDQYGAGIAPVVYELHKPYKTIDELDAHCIDNGTTAQHVAKVFSGVPLKLANVPPEYVTLGELLSQTHRFRFSFNASTRMYFNYAGSQSEEFLWHEQGAMRTIIAILILLNRTRDVTYRRDISVRPQQGFIGNKLGLHHGHSILNFECDPLPMLKRLTDTPGINGRPLHEVRGHICNSKALVESTCAHGDWVVADWKEDGQGHREPRAWTCGHCGGRKWWREYHLRGDPKHGIQTSEYIVTN